MCVCVHMRVRTASLSSLFGICLWIIGSHVDRHFPLTLSQVYVTELQVCCLRETPDFARCCVVITHKGMTCCLKALQRCSKLPRNLVTFVLYRIHSVPRISWTLSNVQEAFIEDFFWLFSFGDIQETLSFGLLKLGFLQYGT